MSKYHQPNGNFKTIFNKVFNVYSNIFLIDNLTAVTTFRCLTSLGGLMKETDGKNWVVWFVKKEKTTNS